MFDALGITRNSPGAIHHTIRSSTTCASSGRAGGCTARCPGSMRSRSLVNAHCKRRERTGPGDEERAEVRDVEHHRVLRHARCSSSTPRYCSGISHPPNSAMRAPSARCSASSGLWRRATSGGLGGSAAVARPTATGAARGRAAAAPLRRVRRRRAATAARARTSRAGAGSRAGTARGRARRGTAPASGAPCGSSW